MWKRVLQRPFLALVAWTVLLHGALFIFVFPWSYLHTHATDGGQYIAIAENLVHGRGFSLRKQSPYVPDTIRTPLYPYALAVAIKFAHSPYATLPVTVLLGCLLPLCAALIARLLTPDRRLWLAAGLIVSLDVNTWYYSFILGSEGVFLPLVAVAITLIAYSLNGRSWKLGLAGGAVLGLAALARPIVQFVPLLVIVGTAGLMWQNRKHRLVLFKLAAAICFAFFIVVSPWLYRNAHLFGVLDYTNVGWFNMYTRVAATAESIHSHIPYDTMRVIYLQRLHAEGYVDHEPVEEQDVHGYEFKPVFKKETMKAINRYPKETVLSQVSAGWTVVSQDITILVLRELGWVRAPYPSFSPLVKLVQDGPVSTFIALSHLAAGPWGYAILARLVWLLFFFAACAAPFFIRRRSPERFSLSLFLTMFMLGIVALSLNAAAQADGRYRSQFIFVEIPLALVALHVLFSHLASRISHRRVEAKCPVCGSSSETRTWGEVRGQRVLRCRFCNTRFVHPMPTADHLSTFYSQAYFTGGHPEGGYVDYDADKRAAADSLDAFVSLIDKHAVAKGKLLDVGAATGVFVEHARRHGWSASGQELSAYAAETAQAKGLDVHAESVEQAAARGAYLAISILDVIEHIPDPRSAVRALVGSLAKGGCMLINTPDAGSLYAKLLGSRWHAVTPPEHLVLFSRRSLIYLCESEGLRVVWSGRVPKRFRLSYIFFTAGRWRGWVWPIRLAESLRRHPALDVSVPLDLRDNIAVVAKRIS